MPVVEELIRREEDGTIREGSLYHYEFQSDQHCVPCPYGSRDSQNLLGGYPEA